MKMSKKIRKRSRRKWARRGYSCADFAAGLMGGVVEHALATVWICLQGAVWGARAIKNKFAGRHRPSSNPAAEAPLASQAGAGTRFQPFCSEELGVKFDDIAGLEEAKREVRLRMILPVTHPEKAARYRIRRGGGILLFGPPGTGKTMLAKAVASELDADFFHIAPADVITSEVGGAERNIAQLFQTVRGSARAVLFLDEIDALVPRRKNNGSTIMLRVISQILGEVDGMRSKKGQSDLLLVGATNEIEMVDPAMLRPGRFDARILVGPPDDDARKVLLQNLLEGLPVAKDNSIAELVRRTEGLTGAEIKGFIQQAADDAFLRDLQNDQSQDLQFDRQAEDAPKRSPGPVKRSRAGRRIHPVKQDHSAATVNQAPGPPPRPLRVCE